MHISKKSSLSKNQQLKNQHKNYHKKQITKNLESQYNLPQKRTNFTNNMDKLQIDWSGYCDELEPY